ncbi:MAG: Fructose-bisphosphate aldolase [Candidatus Poribacteria bacterium]|nr:Fructose-bisphosphate aldolase [Candidatus Poribacteria bacterium]
MLLGKLIRMNRLLNQKTGKMVTVAMDHTVSYGVVAGLDTIQKTIDIIVDACPDAIMTHKGIMEHCFAPHAGKLGFILQSVVSNPYQPNDEHLIADVSEAIMLGADAISVAITVGGDDQARQTEFLGKIVKEARLVGLPVVVHSYPKGKNIPENERFSLENVRYAARIGAEVGVDIVKTYYTGSPDTFAKVVECVPVKVVAAGGPKVTDVKQVLYTVKDIMDAGAAGITYGRNIWQDPNPKGIITAIKAIVHDNVDPKQASEIYANYIPKG